MRVLELFAGSRSVGKVAEAMGHEVCSVDIKPFDKIDLVSDCEFLTIDQLPFIPDVVWASPPCTTYSIAAISHHRYTNGFAPKTDFAAKSDRMIMNVLKLIEGTGAIFYIENPRGALRKMPFMRGLDRVTVWYCRYGDIRAKPTDIWSNNIRSLLNPEATWLPRPICFNGNENCHHEAAPRGARTGTQGLKNNYERSKIPEQLCVEVLEAAQIKIENEKA